MSAENPETMEEWKQFRFPTRDRSTLADVRRAIALENGEVSDEDESGDGGEGGDEGGGSAGPALLMGLHGYPGGVRPEDMDGPAHLPPSIQKRDAMEPLVAPPVRAKEEPTKKPPVLVEEEEVSSWSYDAPRGLLINWRIEKTLILAKMDKVGKLFEYANLVEKNQIDRSGFEAALDLACKDIHGQSLSTIQQNWDPKAMLSWGEMPDKAILPSARPRRRSGSSVH